MTAARIEVSADEIAQSGKNAPAKMTDADRDTAMQIVSGVLIIRNGGIFSKKLQAFR